MRRLAKRVCFCFLLVCFVMLGMLLAERQKLSQELIRFHVIANSDSGEDQQLKLLVRDAVVNSISQDLTAIGDFQAARDYITDNIPKLEAIACEALQSAGVSTPVEVRLEEVPFDIRSWGSLRFPSGVYQTLRIIIGDGDGKNWWCVLFPGYCTDEASFADAAMEAGFTTATVDALYADPEYEVRFFLLDTLGRIQNLLSSK